MMCASIHSMCVSSHPIHSMRVCVVTIMHVAIFSQAMEYISITPCVDEPMGYMWAPTWCAKGKGLERVDRHGVKRLVKRRSAAAFQSLGPLLHHHHHHHHHLQCRSTLCCLSSSSIHALKPIVPSTLHTQCWRCMRNANPAQA